MEPGPSKPPGYRQLPLPQTNSPPPSPQRTAPTDPRKRREFLEETDNCTGVLPIETFIYRRDPFRSTTGRVKFPHPLARSAVPDGLRKMLDQDAPLKSKLLETLEKHQLGLVTLNFSKLSKPGYPAGGDAPVTTLEIVVQPNEIGNEDEWSSAKYACRDILDIYGVDNAEVEIINPGKAFCPSLLPVYPEDPQVQCFEDFRENLMQYVCEEFQQNWTSVCLWKVASGLANLLTEATFQVVIMVKPLMTKNWLQLSHHITRNFIKKSTVGLNDIGVLFMPGDWGLLGGGRSFASDLGSFPTLGSSIGVQGELGGGTCGGYFDLTRSTSSGIIHKTCMLTNAHVIRPSKTASKETRKQYDIQGVQLQLAPDDLKRTIVRYPAVKDVEVTKLSVQRRIESLTRTKEQAVAFQSQQRDDDEKEWDSSDDANVRARLGDRRGRVGRIPACQREIEMAELMGQKQRRIDLLKGDLQCLQEMLSSYESVQGLCTRMPLVVGTTFLSTGRAFNPQGRILDFAFIDIEDEDLLNHVTTKGNDHSMKQWYGYCLNTYPQFRNRKEWKGRFKRPVSLMGSMEKGDWYFKSGRTTDVTAGICNGTEAFINIAGFQTRSGLDGKAGAIEHKRYTKELVIVAATWGLEKKPNSPGEMREARYFQQSFCEYGDSGSLIVDEENQACGLLFGSLAGALGPFTWDGIERPRWWDSEESTEDEEKDDPFGTQPYGKMAPNHFSMYGPGVGIVTSIEDIQAHLKATDGWDLDLVECKVTNDLSRTSA